jgi:hypothetical protein
MNIPCADLRRALLVSFAILPLACSRFGSPVPSAGAARGPIATAPAGALEGRREGGLLVFKGIPYASPPVGEAR